MVCRTDLNLAGPKHPSGRRKPTNSQLCSIPSAVSTSANRRRKSKTGTTICRGSASGLACSRIMIDETHDPALRSWVESANKENTDFPIQNLPLAAYLHGREQRPRIGVAIGNAIFDISQWLPHENLNGYFALTAAERRDLRREWSRALREGAPPRELAPQAECQMLLPAIVPDY